MNKKKQLNMLNEKITKTLEIGYNDLPKEEFVSLSMELFRIYQIATEAMNHEKK